MSEAHSAPQGSEAADAPELNSMDAATAAFAERFRRDDELGEEDQQESELPPEDDAEQQAEDEGDDQQAEQDEPEAPAIDPPVSWPAEEKDRFSQLPPETQAYLAQRESERERFVQSKATEAAEARKAAVALNETTTQLHENYASQLDAVANAVLVPPPDAYLAQTDPQAYVQQDAQHKASVAQWQQITAHAEQVRAQVKEAAEQDRQAFYQGEAQRLREAIPEAADPAQFARIINEAHEFGIKTLGYAPDRMLETTATDVLALRQAAEWKAKADKWDAAQGRRMEAVRAGKDKPQLKPGATQPKGSAQKQSTSDSMTRLRQTGKLADAAAAFRNII